MKVLINNRVIDNQKLKQVLMLIHLGQLQDK